MEEFVTPKEHTDFLAKKLFGAEGEIKDGAIAYIAKGGGGPVQPHTHGHDHLFIVVEGEARIIIGEEDHILKENEAFRVKGTLPHSVWNNADKQCVMIGITVI